ncbi:MAG: LysE family translocator [Candidatus Poseidoniaceae archaeon]|nr:LysE family translocator [Candidatus Poseidoniaceae archaeon]
MVVEWAAVAAATALFVAGATSPGPSLAIVVRNTIIGGRSRGMACAIGHGIGFGFYAVAAVFGLVVLMETQPDLFFFLQMLGVVFLLWMGINLLRAEHEEIQEHESKRKGFMEGFMIAFLNPKIAVFMLFVLAAVLEPGMAEGTKWVIAALGAGIDATWYLIVATILTSGTILERMKENQVRFHQVTGILMISLATWVLVRSFV